MVSLDQHWTDDFRRSPFWLRFELNTGGAYVNMFSSSYDRARRLARAALLTEQPIAVIVDYPSPFWVMNRREGARATIPPFTMLEEMGVSTGGADAVWSGYFYPDDAENEEAAPCEHRAMRVTWDQADILLWNNIAQEIGVEPKAPVLSKLLDQERGVLVNAYDDRGLDVIGLSRESIASLYRQFDGWLLDYDRPRMAATFGVATG